MISYAKIDVAAMLATPRDWHNLLRRLHMADDNRCGTYKGYWWHYRHKEIICNPCRLAYNDRAKKRYASKPKKSLKIINPKEPIIRNECGTVAGYNLHRKNGEAICNDCRLNHNEYRRNKYAKNPLKQKEASERWKLNKPINYKEARIKSGKNIRKNHKEKIAAKNRKRRAKKSGNYSEPYTLEQIFERYGTNCHICLNPIDLSAPRTPSAGEGWEMGLQLDHVIPISKGGADMLENVKPSHAKCNFIKGDG